MYQEPLKLKTKDVPACLRVGYTGRKFKLHPVTTVEIPADANLWSGGTRYQYKAIRLADGATIPLGSHGAPWAKDRENKTIELGVGIVVVLHTIFCGTDCGLTIYSHPSNFPALIKG